MKWQKTIGALALAAASLFSDGCTVTRERKIAGSDDMPVKEDSNYKPFILWKPSSYSNMADGSALKWGIDFNLWDMRWGTIKRPSDIPHKNTLTFDAEMSTGQKWKEERTLFVDSEINKDIYWSDIGAYIKLDGINWGGIKIGKKLPELLHRDGMSANTDKGSIGGATFFINRIWTEPQGIVEYADYNLGWGAWPLGGISAKTHRKNFLYFEVNIARFPKEDYPSSDLYLVGRIDDYKIKWTKWTLKYPYGDEWYSDFDDMVISEDTLTTSRSRTFSLGIKYEFGGERGENSVRPSLYFIKEFPLESSSGADINSISAGLNFRF